MENAFVQQLTANDFHKNNEKFALVNHSKKLSAVSIPYRGSNNPLTKYTMA